jgi:hypothetical protein
MKKNVVWIGILMLLFSLTLQTQSAYAVGPYNPIADAFTILSDPDMTFGTDPYLFLSASNADGCVPSSYVWFKFDVPNPTAAITFATLSVPVDLAYDGDEDLDMELRSSAGTDWDETTISWSNQPVLDAGVLATAPSTVAPNDALFTSPALAAYLNGKKGQTVSLVVKANCNGNVFIEATRLFAARENTLAPHKVELILQGPTQVQLVEMKGMSRAWSQQTVFLGVLAGLLGALVIGKRSKREDKTK